MGMGRRLGLAIGVNHYQDTAFRPLQFAENDAKILGQWLVNVKGGNWSPADVQLVLGARATRELIESLIMQVCLNEAGPDDLVLIYFAGHLFLDETSGEGYLALVNTHYAQPTTGLHIPSLMRQAMGRSRAASVLFILDCFQTGPIWSTGRTSLYDAAPLLGLPLLNILQQVSDRLILYSCRGSEIAPEVGEKNVGRLIHSMILGLCGQASDPVTGQIYLQRLHAFVSTVLDEQHKPQIFGREQYPFVLVGDMPTSISGSPSPGDQLKAQAAYLMSNASTVSPNNSGQLSFEASTANPGQHPLEASPILSGNFPPQQSFSSSEQLSPALSRTTSGLLPPQSSPISAEQLRFPGGEQQRLQYSVMLLGQARQLIQMQKLGEALTTIDRAIEIMPTYVDALILKGQLLGANGRFQEALIIVDQIIQIQANNALAWSMRAALLTNLGQYQDALIAVDRSLAFGPQNAETLAIKDTILTHLARLRNIQPLQPNASLSKQRNGPLSFLLGLGISLVALLIGTTGAAIPIVQPHFPTVVAFLLESIGLAVLCVNAARGAYRHGILRLLLTILMCGLAAGMLGAIYKFGYTHLEASIKTNPPLLVPVLFLGLWLIVAATLPLLLAVGGFIGGIAHRGRRR